jgi:hypothetical protein
MALATSGDFHVNGCLPGKKLVVAKPSSGPQASQEVSLCLFMPSRNALHQPAELGPSQRPLDLVAPETNDVRIADLEAPAAAGQFTVIDADVGNRNRLLAMFTVRADAKQDDGSQPDQVEIQRGAGLLGPASLLAVAPPANRRPEPWRAEWGRVPTNVMKPSRDSL